MGLDQYAYKVKNLDSLKDLEFSKDAMVDSDFDYWRKFYGLQNWMENLYWEKGGTDVFNCTPVRLTLQDLDRLERDMQEDDFYEDRYYKVLEEEKAHEVEHLKWFIKKSARSLS